MSQTILFTISFTLSIIFLSFTFFFHSRSSHKHHPNPDLDTFYSSFNEPVPIQLKYLILAAKSTLRNCINISKEREIITSLFEERVVSDRFYNQFKEFEESMLLEKALIEGEAEGLKAGSKEQVFMEANKQLASEGSVKKKGEIFDEAVFLKRQEGLNKQQ